jgi:hypothetical protein
VLYAPTNFDALAYRVSRMLHWMAEGRWHWIPTYDARLNTRTCGIEWLTMPLLVFTKTDRLFFLANLLSYCFLPGLLFSVFRRLGVRPRVAWAWMWLLPSGYGFVLQAGSIANDLPGVVYALAALDLALRARVSGSPRQVWLSVLAASLLTGSKNSNVPLLLPWLVAILPTLKLLWRAPLMSGVTAVAALLVSFVPTAFLNWKHCGDWTGYSAEAKLFMASNPLFGVVGNTLALGLQNFVPPFFPFANGWNAHVLGWVPEWLRTQLQANFEDGFLEVRELPQEELSGIGPGLSLLALISWLGAACGSWRGGHGKPGAAAQSGAVMVWALIWTPFVSLLGYMAKSGISQAARLIAPYYALLFPALLMSAGQAEVVRQRWWKNCAVAVFVLAGVVVVLTPARPLWPAQATLTRFIAWKPDSRLLQRARTVYAVYAVRADGLAPIRSLLPTEAKVVGLLATPHSEGSLWRPFGERRFKYVMNTETAESLRRAGIKYVVANAPAVEIYFQLTLDEWLRRYQARVVGKATITLTARGGAGDWYLLELQPLASGRHDSN